MSLHLVEALETPYLRWLCFQRAVVGGPELPKTTAATSFPTSAVRSSFIKYLDKICQLVMSSRWVPYLFRATIPKCTGALVQLLQPLELSVK
jgi:hypothetical protein